MIEGVFVAVQDATVVTNTRKIDKYKAVKSTDAATGNGIVAVQDKTTSEKLFNKNVVDAKSVNVPKNASKVRIIWYMAQPQIIFLMQNY